MSETMRERLAKAMYFALMDDGDCLGTALAENFRIDEHVDTADEAETAVYRVLYRGIDAILTELEKPSEGVVRAAASVHGIAIDINEFDELAAMKSALTAAAQAIKEGR